MTDTGPQRLVFLLVFLSSFLGVFARLAEPDPPKTIVAKQNSFLRYAISISKSVGRSTLGAASAEARAYGVDQVMTRLETLLENWTGEDGSAGGYIQVQELLGRRTYTIAMPTSFVGSGWIAAGTAVKAGQGLLEFGNADETEVQASVKDDLIQLGLKASAWMGTQLLGAANIELRLAAVHKLMAQLQWALNKWSDDDKSGGYVQQFDRLGWRFYVIHLQAGWVPSGVSDSSRFLGWSGAQSQQQPIEYY